MFNARYVRSKGGRLVSAYAPIVHPARPVTEPLYYDLNELHKEAWADKDMQGIAMNNGMEQFGQTLTQRG